MSIDAKAFLEFAIYAAAKNDEIGFRNANSRAYYAAYHLSVTKWPEREAEDAAEAKVGMHTRYIKQRLKSRDQLERKVGLKLQTTYGKRIVADYNLNLEVKAGDTVSQLSHVQQIFDLLT